MVRLPGRKGIGWGREGRGKGREANRDGMFAEHLIFNSDPEIYLYIF